MPENIRVTLIEPWAIGTFLQPCSRSELQEQVDEYTMLAPDEVAEAIMFAATRSRGVDVVTLRIEPLVPDGRRPEQLLSFAFHTGRPAEALDRQRSSRP